MKYKVINLVKNDMIEEGLYDNEPGYIRSTLYEKIMGKVPVAGFESHDAVIDRDKLREWLERNKFDLFHCKFSSYADGEERQTRFYINRKKEVMILIRKSVYTLDKDPEVLSSDGDYFDKDKTNKNPNKHTWFSFYGPSEKCILEFREVFKGFLIEETSKDKLYMIKSTEYGGLELDSFPVSCDGMQLDLNYGNDFIKTHDRIVDCFKNKKSGLYIFHGPAGTGKTSYIKYLTTVIDSRKFIFVPNALVAELFSPKLVAKLFTFKNSVLVLEDAEICVFKRDGKNNELVSGILNITDGMLKDLLNISIVVTFNTADIHELDTALLRKGRLKIMHRFGLLSESDAKNLALHLGKKNPVEGPMSLADVYNLDEETGLEEEVKEKRIGFGG